MSGRPTTMRFELLKHQSLLIGDRLALGSRLPLQQKRQVSIRHTQPYCMCASGNESEKRDGVHCCSNAWLHCIGPLTSHRKARLESYRFASFLLRSRLTVSDRINCWWYYKHIMHNSVVCRTSETSCFRCRRTVDVVIVSVMLSLLASLIKSGT